MDGSGPLADFAARLDGAGGEGLAIVVAHPDDETIGVGGHLARLTGADLVLVTDGAPRDLADARARGFAGADAYAAARRDELARALACLDFRGRVTALGVPDRGAPAEMTGIARRLSGHFAERGIRLVLTHPFEGGHPDHDAVALAVAAAGRIAVAAGRAAPGIAEMASYHAGPDGPVFQAFAGDGGPVLERPLGPVALARKWQAIAAHATQRATLAPFRAAAERFRAAPAYDFSALPNGGRLHYEGLPFGFSGADWLRAAAAARVGLGEAFP